MTSTADAFLQDLGELRTAHESAAVPMGRIFALAREHQEMAPSEIERLLEHPDHDVRVGAVSIMDWQARNRRTTEVRRRELFELYLGRHDRIDTWDLVDRAAIWVVGEHLRDKPRDDLDRLARSGGPMERRTAILSTYAFIRRGQLDDTFRIAERLAQDRDELVQKAVGWMLRESGKRDGDRLAGFLEAHAATMPRVMLQYALEKLDADRRRHYLGMRERSGAYGDDAAAGTDLAGHPREPKAAPRRPGRTSPPRSG